MSNKNKLIVPEAKQALDMLKLEIAQDIGFPTYINMPFGFYPAVVNGLSVREMVSRGENMLINKNTASPDYKDL